MLIVKQAKQHARAITYSQGIRQQRPHTHTLSNESSWLLSVSRYVSSMVTVVATIVPICHLDRGNIFQYFSDKYWFNCVTSL